MTRLATLLCQLPAATALVFGLVVAGCQSARSGSAAALQAGGPEVSLTSNATGTIRIALYPYVPRLKQFKDVVEGTWSAQFPGVFLEFVDWDCYSEAPPSDLDVFVFDHIYFQRYVSKGFLWPIPDSMVPVRSDFLPYALSACITGG